MKFYLNGKPVRETTEETSERAAGKALRKRITALEAGQASIEFRGLKVADLVPLIERDYADRQQRSWARVEYAWRCHLALFFAQRRVEDLGSDDRDDYVEKRQDEEASNSTISRELSYLNRMLELGRQTTPRKVTNPFKFKRLTEGNPAKDSSLRNSCRSLRRPAASPITARGTSAITPPWRFWATIWVGAARRAA
jgi:hypothetical protein